MLLKQNSYSFKFQIHLHVDDLEVLNYIQKTLGMGKVYINGTAAMFSVRKQQDVVKIIEIFSKYPLNTFKFLNFLVGVPPFGTPTWPEAWTLKKLLRFT